MTRINFRMGDSVLLDNVHYALGNSNEQGVPLSPLSPGGFRHVMPHEKLLDAYHNKRLRIIRGDISATLSKDVLDNLEKPLEAFDERWRIEAHRRFDFVLAVDRLLARRFSYRDEKGKRRRLFNRRVEGYARMAKLIARMRRRALAREQGVRRQDIDLDQVSGSTLRNWHRRWEKSARHICALVPLHDAKGKPGLRIDPEVVDVIKRQVRETYLSPEQPPLTLVHALIESDVAALNKNRLTKLSAPSLSTVSRWVDDNVEKFELVERREGRKAAEQKFRHVHRVPQAERPNQIVQIDHTKLSILFVDDDAAGGKKCTFRAWLTIAVCVATRMLVGWYISREPPSWASIMGCLGMAIMRKDVAHFGVKSPYPAEGVPEIIVVDNGREFHSHSLMAAAGQLRFEIRFAPRGKPHLKGIVERLLGTIERELLALLPGRTFADTRERGDYPSEKRAAYTLPDFERDFARWAVDIYHNRPHSGLRGKESPLEAWERLATNVYGVVMPPHVDDLHAILSMAVQRTVTNKGIEFIGLMYQSAELQALRRRPGRHLGKEYLVKADPNDLGSVFVMDEVGERWFEVPCLYPELADGTSLLRWKEVTLLARRRTAAQRQVTRATLLQALSDIVDEAKRKGAGPAKVDRRQIDWFREHVDDPIFKFQPVQGKSTGNADRASRRSARGTTPTQENDPSVDSPPEGDMVSFEHVAEPQASDDMHPVEQWTIEDDD